MAAETVVRSVIFWVLYHVATHDIVFPDGALLRIRLEKVDFAQELLLVMFELADHGCDCWGEVATANRRKATLILHLCREVL